MRKWDQEAIGSCVVLQKEQSHGVADRPNLKCDFWHVNLPPYADDISCLSRKQNPVKCNSLPLSVEIYIQRTESGQEIIISLDICLQICVTCSSSWGLGWIMQETSEWFELSTSSIRLKTGKKKTYGKRGRRTLMDWVLEKCESQNIYCKEWERPPSKRSEQVPLSGIAKAFMATNMITWPMCIPELIILATISNRIDLFLSPFSHLLFPLFPFLEFKFTKKKNMNESSSHHCSV